MPAPPSPSPTVSQTDYLERIDGATTEERMSKYNGLVVYLLTV